MDVEQQRRTRMHNAGDHFRKIAQERDVSADNFETHAKACEADVRLGFAAHSGAILRLAETSRKIAALHRDAANALRDLGAEYDKRIIELSDTLRDHDVTVSVKDVGAFMDIVVSDPVTEEERKRYEKWKQQMADITVAAKDVGVFADSVASHSSPVKCPDDDCEGGIVWHNGGERGELFREHATWCLECYPEKDGDEIPGDELADWFAKEEIESVSDPELARHIVEEGDCDE
jgi:hypothetical protein